MAKVTIKGKPTFSREPDRHYDIQKGDLVMLRKSYSGRGKMFESSNQTHSIYLGVFDRIDKYRSASHLDSRVVDRLILDPAYQLEECVQLGGQTITPIIPCKDLFLSQGLSSGLGIYIGKEKILAVLQKMRSLKPHAEWISKLEKPYINKSSRKS